MNLIIAALTIYSFGITYAYKKAVERERIYNKYITIKNLERKKK